MLKVSCGQLRHKMVHITRNLDEKPFSSVYLKSTTVKTFITLLVRHLAGKICSKYPKDSLIRDLIQARITPKRRLVRQKLCVPVWNFAFVQQRIYDIIKHWDKDQN